LTAAPVNTPVSSMLLVVVASFLGSFGAVFLKGGANNLSRSFQGLVYNWRLAIGILFYLTSSVFFVMAQKQGQLSILYPLVSLGYVWTLLWARLFFHEHLTRSKFAGLGLILAGIVFLNLGR
jgi:multidrug transporter EmrE-like cation transporter